MQTDRAWHTSAPRWVRVFGNVMIVAVLFAFLVAFAGIGGPHGPGRHVQTGDAGAAAQWELLILLGVLVIGAVALHRSWLVAVGITLPRHRLPAAVGRWLWWPQTARGRPLMTMGPRLRRLALTVHVACSVGLLGAVAGFLALAIAGLISRDAQVVRASYLAMELTTWSVIVPLSVASLLTGLTQSLGTPWGLFRHYWILVKFLLTVIAVVVLLLQTEAISYMARVAAEATLSSGDLRDVRISLIAHAAGGLLVLLAATMLAVYKPQGMTRYGARMSGHHAGFTAHE